MLDTQQHNINGSMAGHWWGSLSRCLWREDFWLPEGLAWDDLRSTDQLHYPDPFDIWFYPLILSGVYILFCSWIVEPFVLAPLTTLLGVSNKRYPRPQPNETLENLYRKYQMKVPLKALIKSSETTGLNERQIERWLRSRYKSQRFNQRDMFIDCGIKLLGHTMFAVYGYTIMFSKPWVWDITLCWENYPFHTLPRDIWWYYISVLTVYWKLFVSESLQPGRKQDDRLFMILHHAVTVLLMTFSWTCNFIRIGSLVLMVHEIADVPLLAAKMCRYAGKEAAANIIFPLFLVVWIVTRCVLYPFWIMRSMFFDATRYMSVMPSAYVFIALLTGLLMLNLIWTWLILSIVVRKIRGGKLQDFRSSSESENEEENKKRR
ncbi:ceramide synthase 5-like [Penaeus chinensis]|uniref:ceramide synthase 5-like n=1 Tax=Penaeus chinensis TaxID=139456 RepID=UPI001FB687FA|nr:ceramide synthase 5-like [Penaeus chinensis]